MRSIIVKSSKTYEIQLSENIDLLEQAASKVVKLLNPEATYIITDNNVDALYADILQKAFAKENITTYKYVIQAGEQSKNADNYIKILNDMADKAISKSDSIIALGGGVVGDLAGFCAATYLRGITWVQIPTTLLAAVDSSVGGKTAIDLEKGKNLVGAFYQPNLVLCSLKTLDTLDENTFLDGMAEVLKYGIIYSSSLFDTLSNTNIERVKDSLMDIVYECIDIKRVVVQQDELDTDFRHILNYGHTIAHAIEHLSGYSISHGAAVAKGMLLMAKMSNNLGLCSKEDVLKIESVLTQYGFDLSILYSAADMTSVISSDKKRKGASIALVLIEAIGVCVVKKTAMQDIEKLVSQAMEWR